MNRYKKRGLVLILLPIILVIIAMALFATATLTQNSVFRAIGGLLGTIGVSIGGIFLPYAVYALARKDDAAMIALLRQNSAYQNLTDEQVLYLSGWSWGAYLLTTIWALGSKMYLWALGSLVPFFNIYVWLNLAIRGRRLAYLKGWDSFEQLKKRQKIVAIIVGILYGAIIVISILSTIFSIGSFIFQASRPSSSSGAYSLTDNQYNDFLGNLNLNTSPAGNIIPPQVISEPVIEPVFAPVITSASAVPYPTAFSPVHQASFLCTGSIFSGTGKDLFPIASGFSKLPYLGQVLTALSCGPERANELTDLNGLYQQGSTIDLIASPSPELQAALIKIGYSTAPESEGLRWELNSSIEISGFWQLLPFVDEMTADDCINCG